MANWDDFIAEGEEVGELASQDYFQPEGPPPIKPGRYLSRSRELTGSKTNSGNPAVKVKFAREGWTTLKGEEVKDFPPFETLYFHMNKVWDGTGEISAAGAYLKACGKPYMGLSTEELKAALAETENIPVIVRVGWEQDFKELGIDPTTGKKEKPKKTAFFKNPDGSYTHQRNVDGRTYTAKAKVIGYERFKG